MRRRKPKGSARLTLLPGGVGVGESGSAFTTSGCESQGGITSHKILSHQLSVLLSDLEREVEILESKYLEVCATLNLVMARLVELNLFGINTDTTKP